MNKLAKILKEQRESLGLSQQELDKKAGMPKGSVSHLESGARLFNERKINKLAPALGLTYDDFLRLANMCPSVEREMVDKELSDFSPDELLELVLHIRNKKRERQQSLCGT